jgi:hypothetical protein
MTNVAIAAPDKWLPPPTLLTLGQRVDSPGSFHNPALGF